MKVVAIIQARMGSSRLPGKVLEAILEKPTLWHLINRLQTAQLVDKIVIATSINQQDKPIVKFAEENGIDCYAGSELDLVDRLYQTAREYGAEAMVRITGDCPLVDPLVVDRVTKYYLDGQGSLDYVSNVSPRTYPDGLDTEVFSLSALERVWQEVKDPREREMIPENFLEHPKKYRLGNVAYDRDLSAMRWTVDYPDDLKFITEIYRRLYREDKIFVMADILELLTKNPELPEINRRYALYSTEKAI